MLQSEILRHGLVLCNKSGKSPRYVQLGDGVGQSMGHLCEAGRPTDELLEIGSALAAVLEDGARGRGGGIGWRHGGPEDGGDDEDDHQHETRRHGAVARDFTAGGATAPSSLTRHCFLRTARRTTELAETTDDGAVRPVSCETLPRAAHSRLQVWSGPEADFLCRKRTRTGF